MLFTRYLCGQPSHLLQVFVQMSPLILCLLSKTYLLSISKTIYLISDQECEIWAKFLGMINSVLGMLNLK